MKLSTEELKNKPHLLRLLSDQDLLAIGINPESIRSSTSNTSDPNNPTTILSPKALRQLKGQERAQHITFANHLNLYSLTFIHAPTYRKVHDLPLGWPDFTLFKSPLPPDLTQVLFIEFKSPLSGRLSKEQLAFRRIFPVNVCYSALDAINLANDFYKPCKTELPLLYPPKPA